LDESPLSSPGSMLPPAHEEYQFQNINDLLNQHGIIGQAANQEPIMVSANPSQIMYNTDAPNPLDTEVNSQFTMPQQPSFTEAMANLANVAMHGANTDTLMAPSPSADSGISSDQASLYSPVNTLSPANDLSPANAFSPVSLYESSPPEEMNNTSGDDLSFQSSSTETSPRSSIYDGLVAAASSTSNSGRSNLVQLLLGGLNDDSIESDCQIDFNLLDESLTTDSSPRTSICDDEELNRILDGEYFSSRPRSDSSTSGESSVSNNQISAFNSQIQEAIVPSMPIVSDKPIKATRKRKSAEKPTTPNNKSQKRSLPKTSSLNNVDSNTTPAEPSINLSEPTYTGKLPGRKVYKSQEAKERKMSQNRTAALRYRQKKKGELSVMEQEADELEETNGKLRTKVEDMRREIDYLKNLMLDVIKAKLSAKSDLEREETMKLLDELTQNELPKKMDVGD
jgi:hypothetical protein